MSEPQAPPPLSERLDAATPRFPQRAAPRLNRRALLFLLAMAGVLAVAALLLWRGPPGSTSLPASRTSAASEQVSLPQFPKTRGSISDRPPAARDPQSIVADDAEASLPYPGQEVPRRRAPLLPDPEQTLHGADRQVDARGYSLRERRSQRPVDRAAADSDDPAIAAWNDGLQRSAQLAASAQAAPALPPRSDSHTAIARRAIARRLPALGDLLLRGTYIRCVLNNRIITDVSGFASCTVSEPVYSGDGGRLLLPPGTRVLGAYTAGDLQQQRLAMVWDRIVTPDGIEVDLANPGVDDMGSAGHPGHYRAHWGSRIGAAMLISLLGDAVKFAGEQHGPRRDISFPASGTVVSQPFDSNTARTLQRVAEQAVSDATRRRPTLTLQPGARLNVYVMQDVVFPDREAP